MADPRPAEGSDDPEGPGAAGSPAGDGGRIFAARLRRLPLTDDAGLVLGRVHDVLLGPPAGAAPPGVLGFVVDVQRRHILVNVGRLISVTRAGISIRGGTVDLRPFVARPAEVLVSQLLGRKLGSEMVMDVALRPHPRRHWVVDGVALAPARGLYRRTRRVAGWMEAAALFDIGPDAAQAAALRDMDPTDSAATVHSLPPARRAAVAQSLPDEQLADILEELPEEEQVRLLEDMDVDRVADVIEQMEPDDAADLLAAMPPERRARLLEALEPDDADSLRRLLRYDARTAGGLMTPEPVIVGPDTSVAEVLARLRNSDLPPAVAAQVFVTHAPFSTPTGVYIGTIGFQRLLRESPSRPIGECRLVQRSVPADLAELDVAERLAAYNLIAIAVCDEAGRLVGAVTVDDVLDRVLPSDWRQGRRNGRVR